MAPYGGVDPFDPDTDEPIVTWHRLKRARAWLTSRHPALQNVLIAGGGSGHGFKHGPVLGEHIARRALGRTTDDRHDRIFSLERERA